MPAGSAQAAVVTATATSTTLPTGNAGEGTMDPRDRADQTLARARGRGAFVVTPDNATSPMDAASTVQIPHPAFAAGQRRDQNTVLLSTEAGGQQWPTQDQQSTQPPGHGGPAQQPGPSSPQPQSRDPYAGGPAPQTGPYPPHAFPPPQGNGHAGPQRHTGQQSSSPHWSQHGAVPPFPTGTAPQGFQQPPPPGGFGWPTGFEQPGAEQPSQHFGPQAPQPPGGSESAAAPSFGPRGSPEVDPYDPVSGYYVTPDHPDWPDARWR